jgi:hypothetical protein
VRSFAIFPAGRDAGAERAHLFQIRAKIPWRQLAFRQLLENTVLGRGMRLDHDQKLFDHCMPRGFGDARFLQEKKISVNAFRSAAVLAFRRILRYAQSIISIL